MEAVSCPVTHSAGAGSSPKSPQSNESSTSRNSPAAERHTSAASSNELIASPKSDCAICLGKMRNECFTDSCLHQFCFICLLKWSEVKHECPLCKQTFKSIIHNVRSNEEYEEYHLQTRTGNSGQYNNTVNLEIVSRFRYRTTLTPDRRIESVLENLERDLHRRVEPGDVIPSYTTWHLQRTVASFDFRVRVYRDNLWVNSLPIIGRPREMSARHLRRHPEEMQRMIPWLTRELYAILRAPGLSTVALNCVLHLLPRHDVHSTPFWTGMESYLRNHCDHFIHEFYNFARSPYDMGGFDENAVYTTRNVMPMHVVHEVTSDSSDGDVIILSSDDSQHPLTLRSKETSAVPLRSKSPVAGPSRAILPVDEPSPSDASSDSSSKSNSSLPAGLRAIGRRSNITESDLLSCGGRSDSDSCVIVGYVKPVHERTPEIISLASSDPEDNMKKSPTETLHMLQQAYGDRTMRKSRVYDGIHIIKNSTEEMKGLSQNRFKESSHVGTLLNGRSDSSIYSSSSVESSGSEYVPSTVYKSQKKKKKKVNQKGKCGSTAKCKTKTSCSKATVTPTKKRVNTKLEYSSSDSDLSVSSHNHKRSYQRRKTRSSSICSDASRYSSSSSSSKPTYISHKLYSNRTDHSTRRSSCNGKGSWRIKIKVPDVKQEHDYSVVGYESRKSADYSVRNRSGSSSRPKLRSIVITQAASGSDRCQTPVGSSHDRAQKRLTKKGQSYEQDGAVKKVKEELKVEDEFSASPSTSGSTYLYHKGSSQLSHSSHKHEGSSRCSSRSSNRPKHSKKNKRKVKCKKRRDTVSSPERKSHGLKSKKRKRLLSFSDSYDD